jgi:hypothetical protein
MSTISTSLNTVVSPGVSQAQIQTQNVNPQLAPASSAPASTSVAPPASSYQVNLRSSASGTVGQTYNQAGVVSASASATVAPTAWWENKGDDHFSYLLEQNAVSATTTAGRFNGLASGLIERLHVTGANVKQAYITTSVDADAGSKAVAEAGQVSLSDLRDRPDQSLGLSVKLASGQKVSLSIKSNGNGLSVEASSDTELSETDSKALDKLAAGLEAAAQSYFGEQKINLNALSGFDTSVVSSLELNIKSGDRQVDFRIDQSHHQLKLTSPSGVIDIDVKHDNAGLRGNATQREQAIQQFLGQIDSAAKRGHADEGLIAQYKEAFSAVQKINTTDDTDNLSALAPAKAPSFWDAGASSLLTGLADFDAKITGETTTPNPLRLQESDYFNFQTSQKTTQEGQLSSGKISQKLESSLSAAFHLELKSGKKPELGESKNSQNYRYFKVDDHESSKLELGFEKNQLNSARLEKSHDRNLSISSYEFGKLIDSTTVPDKQTTVIDFSVNPTRDNTATEQALQRQRIITGLSGKIFL